MSAEGRAVRSDITPEELYLDLLKRVLTRSGIPATFRIIPAGRQLRHLPRRVVQRVLAARGAQLVLKPDAALRDSGGGYLIVDDYGAAPPCKSAVDTYRRANRIDEPIETIAGGGVFWRRLR